MNELATYQSNLPDTPRELVQFIVIGQEKAKALQAEIRAIKRLELAKEVYEQKQEELDRLRSLMLLAYQQMGSFTRDLSTKQGDRADLELLPASGKKFDKSKSQVIQELGLSTSQASRYEKIAAHPDVVEAVLAEAQAGQTEPTQAEVMRRIKEKESGVVSFADARKKRFDADMEKIGRNYQNIKLFHKAVNLTALYDVTDAVLDSIVSNPDTGVQSFINDLNDAIRLLTDIRTKLILKGAKHGKKNSHARN